MPCQKPLLTSWKKLCTSRSVDILGALPLISVIIPTYNESQNSFLIKSLELFSRNLSHFEVILSHGQSLENLLPITTAFPFVKVIPSDLPSRAARINKGIEQSRHPYLLIHHPRSGLTQEGLDYLYQKQNAISWGAFTHQFDWQPPLLRFTSWYSNHIRGDLRSIYYLDHCLFGQKDLFYQIGLFPEIDIFEDTEICLRLRKITKGQRIPFTSTTSAIRFQQRGLWRQALLNQSLKWAYYLKTSDQKMNEQYEKDLELNTQYKKNNNSKPTRQ